MGVHLADSLHRCSGRRIGRGADCGIILDRVDVILYYSADLRRHVQPLVRRYDRQQ